VFNLYPRIAFRENRIILSKEELKERLEEAKKCNKSCEVGVYAFRIWTNSKPVKESVVIDKVIHKGKEEDLRKIAEEKFREGIDSTLIFDGKSFFLFVYEPLDSLEDLLEIRDNKVKVIKDPFFKITCPGYLNLRTNLKSRVIKRWKRK